MINNRPQNKRTAIHGDFSCYHTRGDFWEGTASELNGFQVRLPLTAPPGREGSIFITLGAKEIMILKKIKFQWNIPGNIGRRLHLWLGACVLLSVRISMCHYFCLFRCVCVCVCVCVCAPAPTPTRECKTESLPWRLPLFLASHFNLLLVNK